MTKPRAAKTAALCPRFHYAVELIGRRWTGAILFLLEQSPARFSDLRAGIAGITDPMLSERLHELEREALVTRRLVPETPPRVEYALTPKGEALREVLCAIGRWSDAWLPAPNAAATPVRRAVRRRTARS